MTIPPAQCDRIAAGESPLKVWREHLGLDQTDLRRDTGISVDIIAKIEAGKKPITREQAKRLARAMDIHAQNLLPHSVAGCADLDVDEDAILAGYKE